MDLDPHIERARHRQEAARRLIVAEEAVSRVLHEDELVLLRQGDDLGRLIDAHGRPVGRAGELLLAPDGSPLPRAPRTRMCEDEVPRRFGVDAVTQGALYRCCDDQIRKLTDCCTTNRTRINGDAGLRGYCRPGRRVFCVMYYDTGVPC